MAAITTRAGKGSPLTNAELDANFTNINDGITTAAAITGGTINGTTIGATTPTTGVFSEIDVDNLELNGNAIISTNTNGNIDLTPNGTGEVNITKVDIDAGTIDNTAIGGSTAAAGAFTTITASSTLNVTGVATLGNGAVLGTPASGTVTNLTGTASININGTVGATTPAAATVTTLTATANSAFTSTGAVTVSKGTTAERPGAPVSGMFRFNTTTAEFEGYNGVAFASVGGAALSNDTTTASNLFPLFASATSGSASSLFTSNAKYLYKPSTGELKVDVPIAGNGIMVNSTTVATSYTIASGNNGFSVGPITVASGQAVTVSSGQRWLVL